MSPCLDQCKMRVHKRGKTTVNGYDLGRGKWKKRENQGANILPSLSYCVSSHNSLPLQKTFKILGIPAQSCSDILTSACNVSELFFLTFFSFFVTFLSCLKNCASQYFQTLTSPFFFWISKVKSSLLCSLSQL